MQQNVKTSSTCTSYLFAKMLYTCISFFGTNVFYMYFLCVLFAVRYKRPVLVRGRGDDTDPAVRHDLGTAQDPGTWSEDVSPCDQSEVRQTHPYHLLRVRSSH